MKKLKDIIKVGLITITACSFSSCTDLGESVYSSVMSDNYYRSKQDIINAVFRPFEGFIPLSTKQTGAKNAVQTS